MFSSSINVIFLMIKHTHSLSLTHTLKHTHTVTNTDMWPLSIVYLELSKSPKLQLSRPYFLPHKCMIPCRQQSPSEFSKYDHLGFHICWYHKKNKGPRFTSRKITPLQVWSYAVSRLQVISRHPTKQSETRCMQIDSISKRAVSCHKLVWLN